MAKKTLPVDWPARLKEIRERVALREGLSRRISQAEAARRIRVSLRSWAGWEIGEEVPSPPFVLLIEMLESGKIQNPTCKSL